MYTSISTLVLSILMTLSLSTRAQGIEFFSGSWEEAKALAKKEGKPIFVDAYAEWCGPCKRMAAQVFTLPEVGEYYNAHFINMKIDMEKGMGLEFGRTYPVRAYPTLMYIDDKGEVIKKVVGAKQGPDFLKLGQEVMAGFDTSLDLAKAYEEGDRSYELVLEYIKALNKSKKPSLKISNDFLRNNPDLTEEQRAVFLFEAMTNADSRMFDMFIKNRAIIEAKMGKTAVEERIEAACKRTLDTAVEFESHDLLKEAQNKIITNLGKNGRSIAAEAEYNFAKATVDIPRMMSIVNDLAANYYRQDAQMLHELCVEIKHYTKVDSRMYASLEEVSKLLAENTALPEHYIMLAEAQQAQNKTKAAAKTAEKALKLAKQQNLDSDEIEKYLAALKKL